MRRVRAYRLFEPHTNLVAKEVGLRTRARAVIAMALTAMFSGCAFKYSYAPKEALYVSPPLPYQVVVTRFQDRTDKLYSKNLNIPENPIGSFSQAVASTLRDRRFFKDVVYSDSEYDPTRREELARTYRNAEWIVHGSVQLYKWDDYPYAASFLPIFWGPALFGLPTGVGCNELSLAYAVEVTDTKNGEVVFSNHYDRRMKKASWGNAYNFVDCASASLSYFVDAGIDDTVQKLRPAAAILGGGGAESPADLGSALPARQWDRDNIAVADLRALALSSNEVSTLSERLRSIIAETDYFRILSEQDMKMVLETQQFQKTDACDDTQCLVELGRILAVERVIGGSLGKVGETFTITLRIVNVETGRLEVSATREWKGPSDKLLQLINETALMLCRKYAKSKAG